MFPIVPKLISLSFSHNFPVRRFTVWHRRRLQHFRLRCSYWYIRSSSSFLRGSRSVLRCTRTFLWCSQLCCQQILCEYLISMQFCTLFKWTFWELPLIFHIIVCNPNFHVGSLHCWCRQCSSGRSLQSGIESLQHPTWSHRCWSRKIILKRFLPLYLFSVKTFWINFFFFQTNIESWFFKCHTK